MSKIYSIFCAVSFCGNIIEGVISIREAREWAKKCGWTRVRVDGKLKDRCRMHSRKEDNSNE